MTTKFVRFAGVGCLATIVHYAILVLLVEVAEMSAVVASGVGFVGSAMLNYSLNRRFTFRSERPHGKALPRFGLIAVTGLGINTALVAVLNEGLSVHYLLAQICATGATIIWTFALNNAWTFPARSAEENPL